MIQPLSQTCAWLALEAFTVVQVCHYPSPMQTFEGFDVPLDDPEAAAPARLVTEAFGVTMTPTVVPSMFHDPRPRR